MPLSVSELTYRIDAANRITDLGEEWTAFAKANAGFALIPSNVIGTPIGSWISDPTTREVYDVLIARIRDRRETLSFRLRCDAPGFRRLLQMQMAVLGEGQVEFRTSLVEAQPRTAMSLMDATLLRSEAQVKICGWCMRLPDETGRWMEIEAAVHALRLFEGLPVPRLSHTMCPDCFTSMDDAIHRGGSDPFGDLTFGKLAP